MKWYGFEKGFWYTGSLCRLLGMPLYIYIYIPIVKLGLGDISENQN